MSIKFAQDASQRKELCKELRKEHFTLGYSGIAI